VKEGLRWKKRNTVHFVFHLGVGGSVAVTVVDEENHLMVDVETREFEYQAKRLLERL